jgi:hypothetical protein
MRKYVLLIAGIFCTLAFGVTVKQNIFLNVFNSGELSPYVNSRTDIAKYQTGAKTVENMLINSQGPVQRRPGTKFISEVKDSTEPVRIITFEYNVTDAYIIEMGKQYMRFYHTVGGIGSRIEVSGVPYEITTPYDSNDLFEIQYAQTAENMLLVHPDYPPQMLTRIGDANWTLTQIDFSGGPFNKENETDISITPDVNQLSIDITNDANVSYFASSNTDEAYLAFDESLVTRWNPTGIAGEYIGCHYETNKTITKVGIYPMCSPYHQNQDRGIRHCKFQASNDGNTWVKVPVNGWYGKCRPYNTNEIEIDNLTSGSWVYFTLNNDVNYPYYRLYIYDHWGSRYGTMLPSLTMSEYADLSGSTSSDTNDMQSVKLIASANIFDPNHVGALWQLKQTVGSVTASGDFTEAGNNYSSAVRVYKTQRYTLATHGTWTGKITIQRSIDGQVTWEDVISFSYSEDGNIQYTGRETENDTQYRIKVFLSYGGTCSYNLVAESFTKKGEVRISSYVDANNVYATILETLGSYDKPTKKWSEGSWSDYRGWPRTVAYHEQRSVFGGSRSYPQTIWGSVVAKDDSDYTNFAAGDVIDTDAWTYVLSGQNPVQWLVSQEYLMVGTQNSIGKMGFSDRPITPNQVDYRVQAQNGSQYIQAIPAVDGILFVERGGKKVRNAMYAYSAEKYAVERYTAADLTILAEHITGDNVTSMALQERPDPTLWLTRSDGQLLSMAYDRDNDIIAWARQVTDGQFESVAQMPAKTGSEDEVWVVVKREVEENLEYPTLRIADGDFEVRTPKDDLTHTTAISDINDLQDMSNDPNGHYYLTGNIEASATAGWNTGSGFLPVGNQDTPFLGTFDGCGYTISGLTINRTGLSGSGLGLFGYISGNAIVANVTLADVNITTGFGYTGALAGYIAANSALSETPKIYNCHSSGTIKGSGSDAIWYVGGLISSCVTVENNGADGRIYVYDSTSSVNIDVNTSYTGTSLESIGGFIGSLTKGTDCNNCRASGNVNTYSAGTTYNQYFGGFTGYAISGDYGENVNITDCSAIGWVTGRTYCGGFVGYSENDVNYASCSARGDVRAYATSGIAGGFAGHSEAAEELPQCFYDCYAWGNVTGGSTTGYAGGFTGTGDDTYTNCYAIGLCSANTVGGFLADGDSTCDYCYWDTDTSETATNDGDATGRNTASMKTYTDYSVNWDFDNVWTMPTGAITDKRYIEQFQPKKWGDTPWFLDCGVNDVNNLNYLRGKTATLYMDDAKQGDYLMDDDGINAINSLVANSIFILVNPDGSILQNPDETQVVIVTAGENHTYLVGLPYTSKFETMPLVVNTERGSSSTKRTQIQNVVMDLYNSRNFKVGSDYSHLSEQLLLNKTPDYFTGLWPAEYPRGTFTSPTIYIEASEPYPFVLRGIYCDLGITFPD